MKKIFAFLAMCVVLAVFAGCATTKMVAMKPMKPEEVQAVKKVTAVIPEKPAETKAEVKNIIADADVSKQQDERDKKDLEKKLSQMVEEKYNGVKTSVDELRNKLAEVEQKTNLHSKQISELDSKVIAILAGLEEFGVLTFRVGNFKPGGSEVTPEMIKQINTVLLYLRSASAKSGLAFEIKIVGLASLDGDSAKNKVLSEKRANNVKLCLNSKIKNADNIKIIGYNGYGGANYAVIKKNDCSAVLYIMSKAMSKKK